MRAKETRKAAQVASKAASKARSKSVKSSLSPKESNLGQQIFVYNHLQTKQVVYSLTQTLKNNHALRQLPYNGKKTVPASLRKDLWAPLACINFTETFPPSGYAADAAEAAESAAATIPTASPIGQYGLLTFQKLREYRKLHETQWPTSFALDPSTNRPLTRIERGRRLCGQKANSVADMAAALGAVTLRRERREVVVHEEREGEAGRRDVVQVLREREVARPLVRATVLWRDILDAELARWWPETVVHDQWITTFNNRRPRARSVVEGGGEGLVAMATTTPHEMEGGKVVL